MGYTIAEKILGAHAKRKVQAGDFVIAQVDYTFGQDGTSAIIIDRVRELCKDKPAAKKLLKTVFSMVIDHSAPSPSEGVSRVHKKMRDFAAEFKVKLYDIGCGVCHQVIPESGEILPGDLVLGADSHTCTHGALGVFSTGVGSTDLAMALVTGKNWFKVPQTIKIVVKGKIPRGVYAKDIILFIIGSIGADGATYKAVEFYGPVIGQLGMDARFTITNMAVEMGAKVGFMPQDKKTLKWLADIVGEKKIKTVSADADARYSDVLEYDVSRLKPQVSLPHAVDTAVDIDKAKGKVIQEAFIGTCTNGRLSDLQAAAAVFRSRKVSPLVKCIIAPASRQVYLQALSKGLIDVFVKANAVVIAPGCGPCVGTHCGIPADAEVVISTANRNFKGRMGNPTASIYLASPATVAASAIEGKIADPRKYL